MSARCFYKIHRSSGSCRPINICAPCIEPISIARVAYTFRCSPIQADFVGQRKSRQCNELEISEWVRSVLFSLLSLEKQGMFGGNAGRGGCCRKRMGEKQTRGGSTSRAFSAVLFILDERNPRDVVPRESGRTLVCLDFGIDRRTSCPYITSLKLSLKPRVGVETRCTSAT